MHIADWKWTLILAVLYAAWMVPLAALIVWRWRKKRAAARKEET